MTVVNTSFSNKSAQGGGRGGGQVILPIISQIVAHKRSSFGMYM